MTALPARFAPTFVPDLPAEQQGRLDAARDLIAHAQSTYTAAVWPALLAVLPLAGRRGHRVAELRERRVRRVRG